MPKPVDKPWDNCAKAHGCSTVRERLKHGIHLQLAKISTLGERVEDTFLISGAELQQNKAQIEIETELLKALQAA